MSAPFSHSPTTQTPADNLDAMCKAFAGESGEVVTDPALAAYLAWVDAVTVHDRVSDEHDEMMARLGVKHPDSAAKFTEYQDALDKREEAESVMDDVVASTPVGALARFAYFTYWSATCMYAGDIRLWQGAVGDVTRLGLLPLPKDIAAFGEGRYFGALHRAAMSKEGIDPSGRSITLPSSLWEPTVEQAGVVYPLPVGVAELMVAEEDRIRVTNAEKAAANPDGTKALDERLRTAFHQLPDEQKSVRLRWLEFDVTASHLHAASLRLARENDLLDEYRDRLVSQLREVADAQFDADMNDLPAPVRTVWVGLIKAAVRGEGLDEAVEAFRRVEREHDLSPDATDAAIAFATDFHRRRIGHGDADLLAAFDEWARLERQDEAASTDDNAPALLAASSQFAQHQPQTMEGVLAALRFLFAVRGENPEHYDTVLNGTEPTERALSDYRDRLLWNTIQAVERMQAGRRASK